MSVVEVVNQRYTAKAYDASRQVPQAQIDELIEVLRMSPSSVNSQPWHFVVAATPEGKARVALAATANFSYNGPKITDASHAIVLCARTDLSEDYLQTVLAQEEKDGRFINEEARQGQYKGRGGYVRLHKEEFHDLLEWTSKQVYIALGTLLFAAGEMGIDATPMEGLDFPVLDEELGLKQQGLTALVVVSLGYHSEDDFNARLPKSRLPEEQVITRI